MRRSRRGGAWPFRTDDGGVGGRRSRHRAGEDHQRVDVRENRRSHTDHATEAVAVEKRAARHPVGNNSLGERRPDAGKRIDLCGCGRVEVEPGPNVARPIEQPAGGDGPAVGVAVGRRRANRRGASALRAGSSSPAAGRARCRVCGRRLPVECRLGRRRRRLAGDARHSHTRAEHGDGANEQERLVIRSQRHGAKVNR